MKHQPSAISTRMLNILLILAILLFPLGQFGRLSFETAGLYLYELPLALFLILGLCILSRDRVTSSKLRYITSPLLIFLGILLITYTISLWWYPAESNLIAGLYLLRLMLYFGALLVLMIASTKQLLWRTHTLYIIFLSTTLIAVSSLVQYMFFPDLRPLMSQGWDPHAYRAFGTMLEPAVLAGLLGISALFFFWKELPSQKVWRYSAIMVLLGIIAVTFSRGAYLALVVGLVPLLRTRQTIVGALLGVVVVGAVVWFAPKPSGEGVNLLRTSTVESRIVDYREAIGIWQERPVTGIGFNHIGEEKEVPPSRYPHHAQSSFHSSFLMILVTSGIFGLGAYLFLLYRLCRVERYLCSLVLFLGTFSLFDNILLHPFILFWSAVTFVYVWKK